MDISVSDEIKQTAELINSAATWGLNEFLVFLFICVIGVLLIVFYYAQRQSSKSIELLTSVIDKHNEAINKSTEATRALTEKIMLDNQLNREKLNNIHDDVKEIKFGIRRKGVGKNFNEHIRQIDEDGLY
ncbi:hypothetical protein KDD93_03610 [Campylobacter sp. faydin G-24]|uniref:Uncharacterized protein n=1 Tax=Campylobacter anatolicus TaxID=2829105 RepID=A0ABS5HHA8_9BACT|nr:hypothetical protein [Campylobacter anatolicus]MBR8463660.1 hypothetical protein [Campylobacter anatolicus]